LRDYHLCFRKNCTSLSSRVQCPFTGIVTAAGILLKVSGIWWVRLGWHCETKESEAVPFVFRLQSEVQLQYYECAELLLLAPLQQWELLLLFCDMWSVIVWAVDETRADGRGPEWQGSCGSNLTITKLAAV